MGALTLVHGHNGHPVTWISHMADVSLYGLDPAGHHVTNVVLHVANVVLLLLVLWRMRLLSPSPPHRHDPTLICAST